MTLQRWTAAEDDELRELWPVRTGDQLALHFRRSRAACIARAHRLNLPEKRARTPRKVNSKLIHAPRPADKSRPVAAAIAASPPPPPPPAPVAEDGTTWVPPPSPPHSRCHWIHGTPGAGQWSWCGEPVLEGRSYCAGHCSVAYRPRTVQHDSRGAA